MAPSYVAGIDIGTSGARTLIVDDGGRVAAEAFAVLPPPVAVGAGREQDAALWWEATIRATHIALKSLSLTGGDPRAIGAVCVDATSGTIVPVDTQCRPVGPGWMYNDGRATTEAKALNAVAGALGVAPTFNASFSAAKVLWLVRQRDARAARTARFLHQSDLVNARLMDTTVAAELATDESNALKTGFDAITRRWSPVLAAVGIDAALLPSVVSTGTTLGVVGPSAAAATGLPAGCRVVAGMTDGTAAAVASGMSQPGEANVTLGTTLVWKLFSREPIVDPQGRLYCHRHPGGAFLPGGAGNAGGEGLARQVVPDDAAPGAALDRLAQQFADDGPGGLLAYPLPRPGERYPFVDAAFAGFADPRAVDAAQRYRAALEGLACIERWGLDVAAALGAAGDGAVWTTGKGARYPRWMQLRADFLGRPVCRAARPESGFGAALIAAMNLWYGGDWPAAARLVATDFRCAPRPEHRARCDDQYAAFRAACAARRGQGDDGG